MNNNYLIRNVNKEWTLSAEELLTLFNRNISSNSQLLEHIGRENIFELIGKSRNESVHSRFIGELLGGAFYDSDERESTFIHFLDILLFRAFEQDKEDEICDSLREAILTRSTTFIPSGTLDIPSPGFEITVGKYLKEYGYDKAASEYSDKDRIDIYLRFNFSKPILGRNCLEVFIENKVGSREHDGQTSAYFDACNNGGYKRPFQLFVYLTPTTESEMNEVRPDSIHYISVNYQDILEYVIEPLLKSPGLAGNKRNILYDYISCLELPAMPDCIGADAKDDRELSIMAAGSSLKVLVTNFLNDPINVRLLEKTISAKVGEALYSTGSGQLLSVEEVVTEVLNRVYYSNHQEILTTLKIIDNCQVFGRQNGAKPFLVYAPAHWQTSTNSRAFLPFNKLFEKDGGLCRPGKDETILPVSVEKYAELMTKELRSMNQTEPADNTLDEVAYSQLRSIDLGEYRQYGNTDFYFRKDVDDKRMEKLKGSGVSIDPVLPDSKDIVLLKNFFSSRRNLILSVYRLLIEMETDTDIRESMMKVFKKACS